MFCTFDPQNEIIVKIQSWVKNTFRYVISCRNQYSMERNSRTRKVNPEYKLTNSQMELNQQNIGNIKEL